MHYYPTNSYDITTGASSTTSGHIFPTGCKAVLLVATQACRVEFGVGTPTAAVGSSTLIPANFPVLLRVTPGATIAAIESPTAGLLNITEMV